MSQMIESFMNQPAVQGLRAQPVELEEAGEAPAGGRALARDAHPLHAVKVRLQVCVGEAEMTVGDLLRAREHEVLVLDRTLEQPVDLLLEGKVVARGQLVAVDDGTFAVRITELPVLLKI
jgi:flagellar motor switch protein FliN